MIIRDILAVKGSHVFATTPDVTLQRVVELLVEHNCGSLVVYERDHSKHMVGIVTERDIMRACAAGRSLQQTLVREIMSRDVVTGTAEDSVEDTMGLMTDNRIRHLPVLEEGMLVGVISIGDVVKAQHDSLSAENFHLKNYIHDSGIFAM
jgi:CBS domain-containing protein